MSGAGDRQSFVWGAHEPSRAASGAPAECKRNFRALLEYKRVSGEGAGNGTRGLVRSPKD